MQNRKQNKTKETETPLIVITQRGKAAIETDGPLIGCTPANGIFRCTASSRFYMGTFPLRGAGNITIHNVNITCDDHERERFTINIDVGNVIDIKDGNGKLLYTHPCIEFKGFKEMGNCIKLPVNFIPVVKFDSECVVIDMKNISHALISDDDAVKEWIQAHVNKQETSDEPTEATTIRIPITDYAEIVQHNYDGSTTCLA